MPKFRTPRPNPQPRPKPEDESTLTFAERVRRRLREDKIERSNQSPIKKHNFVFRASRGEINYIKEVARSVGLTASDLIRYAVFEVIGKSEDVLEFQRELKAAAILKRGATLSDAAIADVEVDGVLIEDVFEPTIFDDIVIDSGDDKDDDPV